MTRPCSRHPGRTAPALWAVRFLEPAAWLISDPQGGQLAACETDVDLLLNDALARVPVGSSVRVEV